MFKTQEVPKIFCGTDLGANVDFAVRTLGLSKLRHAKPPSRRAFFLHIPKTGGTAITQQVSLFYEEERVQPWGARLADLADELVGHAIDLPRSQIWKHKNPTDFDFYGREHVTLSQWQTLNDRFVELRDCIQFTIMRDPVRRSKSMLQHLHRLQESTTQSAYLAGAMSIQERDDEIAFCRLVRSLPLNELLSLQQSYAQDRIRREFRNVATMTYSTASSSASDREHLASAMQNLEKMHFVGIQEDLDGTIRRISQLLDMPMPPKALSSNVGHYNKIIDVETQSLFEGLNTLDIELYRFARSLHESAMQTLPSPEEYNREWARRQSLEGTASGFEITMAGPIPGWGWHCREGGYNDVPYLCWTTSHAVIYLPFHRSASYELELHCHAAMDEQNWHGTKAQVGNQLFDFRVTRIVNGLTVMTTTINGLEGGTAWRKVEIVPAKTISHHELNPECDDVRQKGISVERIRLTRISA